MCLVSANLCEEIAAVRRQVRRLALKDVFVLDETQVRLSESATSTLTLPGNKPYLLVTESEKFALRYDMIACINYDRLFKPAIFSPEKRKELGSKGINTDMLIDYISLSLGPDIHSYTQRPITLLCDKSSIHSRKRMIEAFQSCNVQVRDVVLIPTSSAKRLSPLDNHLFSQWKTLIGDRCPVTQRNIESIMLDCWDEITSENIHTYYGQCLLKRDDDEYQDCPDNNLHQH